MTLIFIFSLLLLLASGLAYYGYQRLNRNQRKKKLLAIRRDRARQQQVRNKYKVIIRDGKKLGVRFDGAAEREQFFNNN